MTIQVKLREVPIQGQLYLVPTGMTWHEGTQRWNVRASRDEDGVRQNHCFPAAKYGGVAQAFLKAYDKLEALRSAEPIETTVHKELQSHFKTKALDVGLDLETVNSPNYSTHYIRASVGSVKAGTRIKKSFRVGVIGRYSDEEYQRVYAKAKEYRDKIVVEHLDKIRKLRKASQDEARALIRSFMLHHQLLPTA